jgi:hypothetical protein
MPSPGRIAIFMVAAFEWPRATRMGRRATDT